MMNSGGGYDQMGRGEWELAVLRAGEVQCYDDRVDPGPGTNSPYLCETCCLLAGITVAWSSRIVGDITLTLDNQSAGKVSQDFEHREFRLISSQGCWNEVVWMKGQLGSRFTVQWRRSHAERRGKFFDADDRTNHLADRLADAGYSTMPP